MAKQKKTGVAIIIGAGPAGLGCAYELTKKKLKGIDISLFDKNDTVGGLARTSKYKNLYFDVGPHRFYTKNKEVFLLWKALLGRQFIKVSRLTRIYYNGKLFLYPIQILDVLYKLGLKESFQSLWSFVHSKIFLRSIEPKTFEQWIIKHFGKKLYQIFFKTYTEKVWGVPCNKIGAEWASQRIKNLNFTEVIRNALFKRKIVKAKSLVEKFYYPLKGAGFIYEKLANNLKRKGVGIKLESEIIKITHSEKKITSVTYKKGGNKKFVKLDTLFSSMPLTTFVKCLDPKPPFTVREAAVKLCYRDHITVNLIVNGENLFPDNWIYIHSPKVKMARVANYNNFSKKMSKRNFSAISVEYFAFQKDKLWKMKDQDLIRLAIKELHTTKLIRRENIVDGFVVRETESYPTYYLGHKKYFNIMKSYVARFENLYLIGRGGLFKYNNMDHSIYSGMLAARNYLSGEKKYNLWHINEDAAYLETK